MEMSPWKDDSRQTPLDWVKISMQGPSFLAVAHTRPSGRGFIDPAMTRVLGMGWLPV